MFKRFLVSAILAVSSISNVCYSLPLAANSPELNQLIALGYDIDALEKADFATTASSSYGKISVGKNGDETTLFRVFRRKKGLSEKKSMSY